MQGRVPEWSEMSNQKAEIYHFECREIQKEYIRQQYRGHDANLGATTNYLSEFF